MTKAQLDATYLAAMVLEKFTQANIDCTSFHGSIAVCEFRDNSTRTRFSFFKACTLLGLQPVELDVGKSQIAHGETVRETAAMISFLSEIMAIRDDKYIHEGHAYQAEVAKYLKESYEEKVLDRRTTVLNLQCDQDHPTQSMSDLIHVIKHFGGEAGLKGKKICMSWAYSPSYGKPLSVAQSIINLLPRYGAHVVLAYPEGYELLPDIVEQAKKGAAEGHGSLTVTNNMDEALKDAEVIYCKSWAPYSIHEKKRDLIRAGKGDSEEMKKMEKDGLAINATHKDWTVTEAKMKLTKPTYSHLLGKQLPEALYMHCLPADISGLSCKDGEVEQDVFERHRVATYLEAKNKPFVQAAMILITRFDDIVKVLDDMITRGDKRRLD
ncbi:Ornithine_transcarbamylase [Hexamita inflata]|nr:Ornithine transcarbamylase [Hexamita inflata]